MDYEQLDKILDRLESAKLRAIEGNETSKLKSEYQVALQNRAYYLQTIAQTVSANPKSYGLPDMESMIYEVALHIFSRQYPDESRKLEELKIKLETN